jgi:asparagine synthase (glutamine-hydrolysing)
VSDFLLDFRPQGRRALRRVAEALRFADDTKAVVIDRAAFGVVITQTGDSALWAPYCAATGSFVTVAGRPVFDDVEWDGARTVEGNGGLAAKIIYSRVQALGVAALENVNGNCGVIVYDAPGQLVHLVTDACGVFPTFEVEAPEGWLYGSHPDVLAATANERHRLDETSLAEFILSGTVTPPYSYYDRIRAADSGTIFTLDVSGHRSRRPAKRRYFEFSYRGDISVPEEDLASQLAAALRRAVQRRTLPRLGPTAVALSGGLDSRVVLACSVDKERTFAFCCYDEPNRELRTAETIARSLSARFLPLQRGIDYYADHAERGVRISGGMGNFANNHFLGVIPRLKDEGMENLLTGCYCDYLFKALPLNRRVHWFTQREALAPFRHQFYFDHISASTALAGRARERLESRIPRQLQKQDSSSAVFQVEARRTFPLCYEGDNQQRLVPQRTTGWCPPCVDRDLMDVYCRLPYNFKLNRSVFRKAVVALAPGLRAVPDSNTGAPPDAFPAREWLGTHQLRLQRTWRRLSGSKANEGSWPVWQQYLTQSRKLDDLWKRPNPDAMDLFRRVLGTSELSDDVESLKRERPFLFVGLLTVKLWLDQHAS